jgi:drug/metabolite transporter (DMT)-like permease
MHKPADWAAFLAVVLIWSTTPLAIVVSSVAIDPYLSLAMRMLLSLVILGIWFLWQKRAIPFHASAWQVYFYVGVVGIALSMSCAYQAAQTLPSSWIALIFGLAPVFTGILEGFIFKTLRLQARHWFAIVLAIIGLAIVVNDPERHMSSNLLAGAFLMIVSTFLHALSASMVKRVPIAIAPVDTVMGGLLFATPIILLFWLVNGAIIPEQIEIKQGLSIIYLGVIGSLAGFLLYYQVLKVFSATMSSFVTLLAPPLALIWAAWLNNETVSELLIIGAGLILAGLATFILNPAAKVK